MAIKNQPQNIIKFNSYKTLLMFGVCATQPFIFGMPFCIDIIYLSIFFSIVASVFVLIARIKKSDIYTWIASAILIGGMFVASNKSIIICKNTNDFLKEIEYILVVLFGISGCSIFYNRFLIAKFNKNKK